MANDQRFATITIGNCSWPDSVLYQKEKVFGLIITTEESAESGKKNLSPIIGC
jgi:hypothetical protein